MLTPDFQKFADGLLPIIVQDANTRAVLMLGYMNEEALRQTESSGLVTFFSRPRGRLWTKGETSGQFLRVQSMALDCDRDCLLIQAAPGGPVCHTGAATCFSQSNEPLFLAKLEDTIAARITADANDSYVASLHRKGIAKVAQKVGEEAVELVIEAMRDDDVRFREEAADLLFHYLILLQARGLRLADVEAVLQERHPPAQQNLEQ